MLQTYPFSENKLFLIKTSSIAIYFYFCEKQVSRTIFSHYLYETISNLSKRNLTISFTKLPYKSFKLFFIRLCITEETIYALTNFSQVVNYILIYIEVLSFISKNVQVLVIKREKDKIGLQFI